MDEPTGIRRMILHALKMGKGRTIGELAAVLGVTYEAVRLQMAQLERDGWISGGVKHGARRAAGRPITAYALTPAGEHLFPKHYDQLAINLLATIGAEMGEEVVHRLLASITDAQVARWEPLLRGRSLRDRVEILKDLYGNEDAFMEVEVTGDGFLLAERNCPYFNVAMAHTALCSTSVSALTRLLGVRVERVERFQNGDRRCVFRVHANQQIEAGSVTFQLEPPVPVTPEPPRRAQPD